MADKTRAKRALTKFGIKVKKRLVEMNMEQRELAKALGVSDSYLADVLRGDKKGLKYQDAINEILGFNAGPNKKLKEVI
ncbi:helix-turn-helix domain-containing protein [Anaerosolibacter sp.]|uniref:helix-turn-helix domain-containing protein n=1 Tax=Anaerosolibacter sp. TaxID=1872527 RepID=UPI0039EEDF70